MDKQWKQFDSENWNSEKSQDETHTGSHEHVCDKAMKLGEIN